MKKSHLLLGSAILLSISGTAFAQERKNAGDNSNQIQDIIVTARRSSESLMTVPVAVAAISGEEISQAGATNLVDISRMVPQLKIERTSGGSGGIIALRGLSTPVNDAGLDQSVGINIDGVQVGRSNIISQGFFDLAQVEVLKGPQALFFGKNSPAGVISLRSANPTDKLEG